MTVIGLLRLIGVLVSIYICMYHIVEWDDIGTAEVRGKHVMRGKSLMSGGWPSWYMYQFLIMGSFWVAAAAQNGLRCGL